MVASTGGYGGGRRGRGGAGDGEKVQGMTGQQLRMTHNMNQHAIIVLLYTMASTTSTITSRCDYVCLHQARFTKNIS